MIRGMTSELPPHALSPWLPTLRCPQTGECLSLSDDSTLAALNDAMGRGIIKNKLGDLSSRKLDAALINESLTFLYPIRCGIPILLHGEAIHTHQIDTNNASRPNVSADGTIRDSSQAG